MYDFHRDKERYFDITTRVTEDYVIPFINNYKDISPETRVLEVGCGEGGVLHAFLKKGCYGVGIELLEGRAALAEKYLKSYIDGGRAEVLAQNIYDIDPVEDLQALFDIIVLKDVIEHIPNQEKFIPFLGSFLKPGGVVFFGFPPWQMPFGGHQQVCANKVLSKLPWFHLLPKWLYLQILAWGGETTAKIKGLEEIKETGISIERCERIIKSSGFQIIGEKSWLINPVYSWKFGMKPKLLTGILKSIPGLRNFYTTAKYLLFTSA